MFPSVCLYLFLSLFIIFQYLKGLFNDFASEVHETVPRSKIQDTKNAFLFSTPVAANVDFMMQLGVVQLVDYFGPRRDTIKIARSGLK